MAFYVGDIPAEDIVIEPARNGEPIELDVFTTVSVKIIGALGLVADTSGFSASIDGDSVVIEWPGESVLTESGPFTLVPVLESEDGKQEQLAPLVFIVQKPDGWHTIDSARAEWLDAPDDLKLYQLLSIARDQVEAFAPRGAVLPVPVRYRYAQLVQARNLWNANRTDPAGAVGDDAFSFRPFPMDWVVKNIIRPKRAWGALG